MGLAARLSTTSAPPEPLAVEVTVGPVDNRAMPASPDDQGGGPGELGGQGPLVPISLDEETSALPTLRSKPTWPRTPRPRPSDEEDTAEPLPATREASASSRALGLGGGGGRVAAPVAASAQASDQALSSSV